MFGCLKKFIFIIILILAAIGFVAIGGWQFVSEFIHNPFQQAQTTKMEKAAQIADFSKIDKEFELVSSSKLPKIGNYVYVKHGATSQRFYFSKPTKNDTLTKADFNNKKANEKIMDFVKDFKILQFENFEIKGQDSVKAMGQTIPYVKFDSDIVNIPVHGVQGIIGVAEQDGKNVIIISMNTYGKYSQIITNVLLNELK
ncbi:MAG: hypothetical protein K6C94_04415 [Candidatus Gastranaerophilales bacterium]|nr:hypothetical protein [Candidatus Gastranaerophilales bacterium]